MSSFLCHFRSAGLTALLLSSAAAQAAPVQWAVADGGNDHWYEFVSDAVTWDGALAGAAARTHAGLSGYLATATSSAENIFVSSVVAGGQVAWIAASDNGNEGVWTWRAGPETGAAVTYFPWAGGEPNNCCGGENYVQTNWAGPGLWNDHGGPGNASQVNGYLVEYAAAVPEPETYAMLLAGLGVLGFMGKRRKAG